MKAYTDLEQSRKLVEILPLETADMCYVKHSSSYNPNWEFDEDFPPMILGNVPINEITVEVLPCWSLAALLGVLPDRTCVFKKTYKDGRVKYQGVMEENKELILKDNPIDACYEMVIWLLENDYIKK